MSEVFCLPPPEPTKKCSLVLYSWLFIGPIHLLAGLQEWWLTRTRTRTRTARPANISVLKGYQYTS